jgi:acyl carrier protein
MDETLNTVTKFLRELFDEYEGPVTRELRAADVPQWDSLGHVQLIVLVEQAFGIRFNSGEVRGFNNLGDLVDAIEKKKSTAS